MEILIEVAQIVKFPYMLGPCQKDLTAKYISFHKRISFSICSPTKQEILQKLLVACLAIFAFFTCEPVILLYLDWFDFCN